LVGVFTSPLIIITPSPCIPLPLFKGKGEEFLKEGLCPSQTPITWGFALSNSHCVSLYFIRGRGSVNERGGSAPSQQSLPLSNRRTIAHKYRELFERGIKGPPRNRRFRGVRLRGRVFHSTKTEQYLAKKPLTTIK